MVWLFGKKKAASTKFKSRSPMTRKEKLLKLAQSDNYYAVTITRCGCSAASKLISKSFLFENAPALPLPNCTATQCTCEYQGLINRRQAERRLAQRRLSIRMDKDRRQNSRRKDEALWNNYSV